MSLETHKQQLTAIITRINAEHLGGVYDEEGSLLLKVEDSIQRLVDEMDTGDTLWQFVRPLEEYPLASPIEEATNPLETIKRTAFFVIADALYDAVPEYTVD